MKYFLTVIQLAVFFDPNHTSFFPGNCRGGIVQIRSRSKFGIWGLSFGIPRHCWEPSCSSPRGPLAGAVPPGGPGRAPGRWYGAAANAVVAVAVGGVGTGRRDAETPLTLNECLRTEIAAWEEEEGERGPGTRLCPVHPAAVGCRCQRGDAGRRQPCLLLPPPAPLGGRWGRAHPVGGSPGGRRG